MSYEIEYRRIVFTKDPTLPVDHSDNTLYAFAEQGSNNCYDSDTGRRSRSWDFVAAGQPYDIIREICTRAGHTEGGSLKLRGRSTTPENYIKLWRRAIQNAVPLTQQRLPITHARLYLPKQMPELDRYYADRFHELQESDVWRKSKWCHETCYDRPIYTAEDLDDWLSYRHLPFVASLSVW